MHELSLRERSSRDRASLRRVGFRRTRLLLVTGLMLMAPGASGQGNGPKGGAGSSAVPANFSTFEVVSIHRSAPDPTTFGFNVSPAGKFTAWAQTVNDLVSFAYDAKHRALSGGPGWADSERFDINAKMEDSLAEAWNNLPLKERNDQLRPLIRSMLVDRFQLKIRHEKKEIPIYALVVAKHGPKLTPASSPAGDPNNGGSKTPRGMMVRLTGDPGR
jgi:uncharacterized protein (TIGR03435 family)